MTPIRSMHIAASLTICPSFLPTEARGAENLRNYPKCPDRPAPQLTWAQQDRYRTRTISERVHARLKMSLGLAHSRAPSR